VKSTEGTNSKAALVKNGGGTPMKFVVQLDLTGWFEVGLPTGRALADFNNALQITQTFPEQLDQTNKDQAKAYSLNGRAAAYAALGDLVRAQEDFIESISLCPKNAWVYFNQAVACERRSDRKAAITNYRISLKMDDPKLILRLRTSAEERLKALHSQDDSPQP
jgi:tetratricopeptide (TPR) repeat protein